MASRAKQLGLVLAKVIAVGVIAAAGYGLGSGWADHQYGVIEPPALTPAR